MEQRCSRFYFEFEKNDDFCLKWFSIEEMSATFWSRNYWIFKNILLPKTNEVESGK